MNRLRPSHVEREAIRDILSQGYAEGRIEFEEFERKQELVAEAGTITELLQVADGLPTGQLEFAAPNAPSLPEPVQAPSWSRRGFLAVGAAALGFVLAGGIGRAAAHLFPETGDIPQPAETLEVTHFDYLAPGAIDPQVAAVRDLGYTHFTDISISEHTIRFDAVSPERPDVTDTITVVGETLEVEPGDELDDTPTFTLDDVDLALLPDFIAAAPDVVGGIAVSHVAIGFWQEQVVVRVQVEGDDYGAGGGTAFWSPDGTVLLGVSR